MRLKIIIFGLFLSVSLHAQQEAQYTHYMYNTSNFNPAYAGSRSVISILLMHRNQWVGLDGAPKTNVLTAHAPVTDKIGVGLSFTNETIGPADENTINLDFSYTIPTSNTFNLAFGVKGTGNFLNVDFNKLTARNPNDKLLLNNRTNIDNKFSPNVGAGLFWYSDKTYIGLSVPHILETKYYDNSNDVQLVASERMHLHAMAGYVFDLSSNLKFKPSTLVKIVDGSPLQIDLSANFLINEKLTLGAAYRWSAAFSGMAGFQLSNSWLIGYSYDKDTNRLGNFNSGSHEIFLRFELARRNNRIVTPRFF